MKTKLACAMLFAGICCLFVHLAEAGPSLVVTKPPVLPNTLLTGPAVDPAARNGQWFIDGQGTETVRTNEFYDDILGGQAGYQAISGYVSTVQFAIGLPPQPITAFSIEATIINDTGLALEWSSGSNSHGETLSATGQYVGPMVDTKLAAEFAVVDLSKLPSPFVSPYRDRQPYIVADNEDQAAWYCWNPEDQQHQPKGDYFVPTWDFGTIDPGKSATQSLHFSIPAGLPFTDSRYAVIMQSYTTSNDVLQNRTTSLKISTWIDDIALDTGSGQEELPLRHSDVSVFHNQGGEEPELLDFGDAPDSPAAPGYPTLLANNGARHGIVLGVFMGNLVDPEADGQPTASADGDDLNPAIGIDDEDGVTFPMPLYPGVGATVDVVCSVSGFLSAWIDYNADGDWADPGETIFSVQAVAAGTNSLAFSIPATATTGATFARFRFTTLQTPIGYNGLILNGEVEDYKVSIQKEPEENLDFGDAMDSPAGAGYPTLLVNNGARHAVVPGVFLGALVDAEPDGQPTLNADGDDLNPLMMPDDEDGVTLPPMLIAGAGGQVQVVASVPGFLNAWIDWNANGTWIDPGEQVFMNTPLNPGINVLPLSVPLPPALVAGGPHSRWRFTTYAPLVPAFTGSETDGEVEDYEVRLEVLDFGDAPDPSYPTLLANDGARHRMPSAYWLGATAPDAEPDGLPTATATGDDNANTDDEDGVTTAGSLVRGSSGNLNVPASTNGYLNAWFDFNQDGDWSDAGEQVASALALVQGGNTVSFSVPASARLGPVIARFRFGSARGLGVTGLATDGEVEDQVFILYQKGPDTNAFVITNIVHTGTNEMTIWWAGESNVTYCTQYLLDLLSTASPPWILWGPEVTSAPYLQIDTNAAETTRFYRVVAPYAPPPP
jgi:hypothetical protein